METQDEILENIKNAIKKEANIEFKRIDKDIKFDTMGIDSLNKVAVLVSLGKVYKIRIPQLDTVGAVVKYIHENRKD